MICNKCKVKIINGGICPLCKTRTEDYSESASTFSHKTQKDFYNLAFNKFKRIAGWSLFGLIILTGTLLFIFL